MSDGWVKIKERVSFLYNAEITGESNYAIVQCDSLCRLTNTMDDLLDHGFTCIGGPFTDTAYGGRTVYLQAICKFDIKIKGAYERAEK